MKRIPKLIKLKKPWVIGISLLLIGVSLGLILFAWAAAGEIYDYQDTVDGVHLPKVDAIVCLSGGRGRIAAAADIWYRYWELTRRPIPGAGEQPTPDKAPILYISGMGHKSNWLVLTKQVRRGVLEALTPDYVVLETESENTDANAKVFSRIARERGWEKILLITSRYHMKRARLIFMRVMEAQEHPIQVETLSVYQEPFEPDEWRSAFQGVRITLMEYIKWIYYKSFWTP